MKFLVRRSSVWDDDGIPTESVELETLDQLLVLVEQSGYPVIVDRVRYLDDKPWSLEIYDYYRE